MILLKPSTIDCVEIMTENGIRKIICPVCRTILAEYKVDAAEKPKLRDCPHFFWLVISKKRFDPNTPPPVAQLTVWWHRHHLWTIDTDDAIYELVPR